MKTFGHLPGWCWGVIGLLCGVGAVYGVWAVLGRNFEVQVRVAASFPVLADYRSVTHVWEGSPELMQQRDEFACREFSSAYSDPVQVSVYDNGAMLYLTRVWKAGEGYLVLTAGRDPYDYEMSIRHVDVMPTIDRPFERRVEMMTITKSFLADYKVVFIPIPSDGVLVEDDGSSYRVDGKRIEAGVGAE